MFYQNWCIHEELNTCIKTSEIKIMMAVDGRPELLERSWHDTKGGCWRLSKTKTQKLTSYKGWPLTATLNWNTEVGIIQRVAVDGHPKLKHRSWHHTKGGRWRPPYIETQKLASYKGWPLTVTHLKGKCTLIWVVVWSCSSLVVVGCCMYTSTSPLGTRSSIFFLHVARSCFFRVLL